MLGIGFVASAAEVEDNELDADNRVTAHRKNPDTKQLAWTWEYERKFTLKWLECDQTLPLKLLAGKMFSQTQGSVILPTNSPMPSADFTANGPIGLDNNQTECTG